MTAADIYRSHVFCNAYCTSFFEKTIDKSASFDIIDTVPNELNIWGYSSAGRALEWHSRGQRFDPAYLHQKSQNAFEKPHFGNKMRFFIFIIILACRPRVYTPPA